MGVKKHALILIEKATARAVNMRFPVYSAKTGIHARLRFNCEIIANTRYLICILRLDKRSASVAIYLAKYSQSIASYITYI